MLKSSLLLGVYRGLGRIRVDPAALFFLTFWLLSSPRVTRHTVRQTVDAFSLAEQRLMQRAEWAEKTLKESNSADQLFFVHLRNSFTGIGRAREGGRCMGTM